jgi:hypothetical protein
VLDLLRLRRVNQRMGRKLQADRNTVGFELYQLPVLEDVPRLFRAW